MSDWVKFYDFKHSVIYVNARHRDVHYRRIAEDIRAYVPSPAAHVLDYGCGEATSSDLVAGACAQLVLVEAAPNVRASLTMRYAGHPKIAVIAAEQAAALPKASFDLVVMHSVAQYLTQAELDGLLAMFRALLKPDGRFILGDIVPPHFAAPAAALSLLRFGARQRLLLGGGIRARAHFRVGLSAPEEDRRAVTLCRGRDARPSAQGRVQSRARQAQHRP